MTVANARVQAINHGEVVAGDYVLYWMQQSQRAEHNPALDLAIREANRLNKPLVVGFGLTDAYPEANLRHFRFMLEGLQDVQAALHRKGVPLVVRLGDPARVALDLGRRAALIVCDVGYLRHQRLWRRVVADGAGCRVLQVEADVVVPVREVSNKAEYAARTIRPRIHNQLDTYLRLPRAVKLRQPSLGLGIHGVNIEDVDQVLSGLTLDRSVSPVTAFLKGGTREAKRRLRRFIRHHLVHYDAHSNQPQTDDISHMSPYLHFGQISPVYVGLQVRRAQQGLESDRAAYLEELIVRRELAINFVYYTKDYDRYACLPDWARKTLTEHTGDPRSPIYSRDTLEAAGTHDPYWNAAMREMRYTGFMHNYMRMYWGKKILQWSADPEDAFNTALLINNKYFLDGRDPNSYAGVAWTFGKHDRAWAERQVFGKVRYMAASGLRRKCDIEAYVRKVDERISKLKAE